MAIKLLALSVLVLAIGANGLDILGNVLGGDGIIGGLLGGAGGLGGLLGGNGLVGGLLGSNGLVGGLLSGNGLIGGLLGSNGLVGGLVGNLLHIVSGLLNGLLGIPLGLLSIADADGLLVSLLTNNPVLAILGEKGLAGILMSISGKIVPLLTTVGQLLTSKLAEDKALQELLTEVAGLLQEILTEIATLIGQLVAILPELLIGPTGVSGAPSDASTGAF